MNSVAFPILILSVILIEISGKGIPQFGGRLVAAGRVFLKTF
jgi:hypothetical protein